MRSEADRFVWSQRPACAKLGGPQAPQPARTARSRTRTAATGRGGRGMPNDRTTPDEEVALLVPEVRSGPEALPAERCLEIHRLMVRARAMEERMIKMSKSG